MGQHLQEYGHGHSPHGENDKDSCMTKFRSLDDEPSSAAHPS